MRLPRGMHRRRGTGRKRRISERHLFLENLPERHSNRFDGGVRVESQTNRKQHSEPSSVGLAKGTSRRTDSSDEGLSRITVGCEGRQERLSRMGNEAGGIK